MGSPVAAAASASAPGGRARSARASSTDSPGLGVAAARPAGQVAHGSGCLPVVEDARGCVRGRRRRRPHRWRSQDRAGHGLSHEARSHPAHEAHQSSHRRDRGRRRSRPSPAPRRGARGRPPARHPPARHPPRLGDRASRGSECLRGGGPGRALRHRQEGLLGDAGGEDGRHCRAHGLLALAPQRQVSIRDAAEPDAHGQLAPAGAGGVGDLLEARGRRGRRSRRAKAPGRAHAGRRRPRR